MIDWSKIAPLTPDELKGLDEARWSEDELVVRIATVLYRAHMSDLVYGGNPEVIDASGWTRGTLEAVAMLIARELVGDLSDEDRFRLARSASWLESEFPTDPDMTLIPRVLRPLVANVDLDDEAAHERWPRKP